jgi:hypothetical protein
MRRWRWRQVGDILKAVVDCRIRRGLNGSAQWLRSATHFVHGTRVVEAFEPSMESEYHIHRQAARPMVQ